MKKSATENIALLIAMLVGAVLGVGSIWYVERTGWTLEGVPGADPSFAFCILIFLGIMLAWIVHVAMHELGHVIFGMITGYKFVSYRILSFGICKKNGKWKMFRMHVPGTGGQALMKPPVYKEGEKNPYFLYNVGGVIMNFVLAAISFVLVITISNQIIYFFTVSSVILGILMGIRNGYPYYKRKNADGSNIRKLHRHPEYIKYFYMSLDVVEEMKEGKTWLEYSPEQFEVKEVPDNQICVNPKLYQIYTLYARKEFGRAREVLSQIVPYKNQLSVGYVTDITLEELFLELIGENDAKRVEALFTEEVCGFIKKMKADPTVFRVRMAYEWFREEDAVAAMGCYEKIQELRNKVLYAGELELELVLVDYIKERMEQTSVLQNNQNQV